LVMVAAAEVEEGLTAVEMLVDIFQIVVDHFHHLSGGSVSPNRNGTSKVVIRADAAVHISLRLLGSCLPGGPRGRFYRSSSISFGITECYFHHQIFPPVLVTFQRTRRDHTRSDQCRFAKLTRSYPPLPDVLLLVDLFELLPTLLLLAL